VTYQTLADVSVNVAGQVCFLAHVSDSRGRQTGAGIFATNAAGKLQLVARTAGKITFGGRAHVIQSVALPGLGSGGQDGLPSPLDDNGHLAFTAMFNDGTSGLFEADTK
jgi:hypothetical protein